MFHSRIVLIGISAALLLGSGCTENTITPSEKNKGVRITPTATNTNAPSLRLALVIGNGNYKPKMDERLGCSISPGTVFSITIPIT